MKKQLFGLKKTSRPRAPVAPLRRHVARKKSKVSTASPRQSSDRHFPIVGVGASAGGLEAFTQLLKHLPADTGMGFVLVQHLDPAHESALAELLSRTSSMPVCEATNNLR